MSKIGIVWVALLVAPCAFAQQETNQQQGGGGGGAGRRDTVHRVDPGQMYHRLYARVPLVGTGKKGDPIRPMFAPLPSGHKTHSGIIGYTMLISDDGQWALCEFVGATPQDLQVITSAAGNNVVVFDSGASTIQEIETEFQKYIKNFTFASFEPFTTRVE